MQIEIGKPVSPVLTKSLRGSPMNPNTMTFQEILFHGRYHIIGGALFLVFLGAFLRETVRELMMMWNGRSHKFREVAFGPILHDPMLGHTMTDGGEPEKKSDPVE